MLHHIRHSTGGSFGELKQTAREMLVGDDGLTKKTPQMGRACLERDSAFPRRVLSSAGLRDGSSARVSEENLGSG